MREGRAIPHTDRKRDGSSPFCSYASLSSQIGAPATGREATNGCTSPHQSFQKSDRLPYMATALDAPANTSTEQPIKVAAFLLFFNKGDTLQTAAGEESKPHRGITLSPLWNLPPATIAKSIQNPQALYVRNGWGIPVHYFSY